MRLRMKVISITKMGGGLNNQKIMLLGLLITAIENNSAINIPPLINYVTNKKSNIFKKYLYGKLFYPLFDRYIPFFKMFDRSLFNFFLEKYTIITSTKKQGKKLHNEDMFLKGSEAIDSFIKNENYQYKDFISDFFKYLHPSIYLQEKIDFFIEQAQPFDAVCQLRVEDDWPLDVESTWEDKNKDIKMPSQVNRSIIIFDKIKRTLPKLKNIYVTYDKNGLKIPFSEISTEINNKFDFNLKSKYASKNKKLNPKNALEASIIDFEISVFSNVYIGTDMSSFTLLSNLTKSSRENNKLEHRYLYGKKKNQLDNFMNQREKR